MRFSARFTIRTFLALENKLADFRLIRPKMSSLVLFLIMVVRTAFQVMRVRIQRARVYLENRKV